MSINLVIFTLALTLGIKAHAADVRIPTQTLQEVLEGKSTHTSPNNAYSELHARLVEISGPIDEGSDERLKQKGQVDKEKFVNIVLSLSGFLGFKDTAALSRTTADYDDDIKLITLAQNILLYRIRNWSKEERNLNFYEARLRRLKLKSTIRNERITLDEADPSSAERGYIWFLLNKHPNALKSLLYEKAYLVAHYDYFPTKNREVDYNNAIELLKDFISPRRSSNKRPRIGSFGFEIGAETAGNIIPTATAAIPAEPEIAKRLPLPKVTNQEKEDAKKLIKILKDKMRDAGIASSESSDSIDSSDDEESDRDENHAILAVSAGASSAAVRIFPTTNMLSSSSNTTSLSPFLKKPPAGLSVKTVGLGPVIDGLLTTAAIPSELHNFTPFSPAASATSVPTRRPRAAWGTGLGRKQREPLAETAEKFDSSMAMSSEVDGGMDSSVGNGRKRKNRYVIESSSDDSDSEHEHVASSSSALPRDEKNRLISEALKTLGPKEKWAQNWTYQQIAKRAGIGIQKWDVSTYVDKFAPELKKYTRQGETQQERTDDRIRYALEAEDRRVAENLGAKRLTRAQIAAQLSEDTTQPQITDAMIAHYLDRRGTDLKGRKAQEAEDRRSRIAEALAQNDADIAKGKRSKTRAQIAADAGKDINAGMVTHYVTEFDTRPKQPPKPKAPKLTDYQKEQIQELLSVDRSMEHKEVARRVSCASTQVSKYVDNHAKHLKKRTFDHYERRSAEEVEASDERIKNLIRKNKNIGDVELIEQLKITKGMLRGFFKRNPTLQLAYRK